MLPTRVLIDRLKERWLHAWQRLAGAPEPDLAPPLATDLPPEVQADPQRAAGRFDPRYPVS